MAKIIELIETEFHVGNGTHESPYRNIQKLFTKEGVLIAEYDSWALTSWYINKDTQKPPGNVDDQIFVRYEKQEVK